SWARICRKTSCGPQSSSRPRTSTSNEWLIPMPILHREREPALYYEIANYTDPWCDAPYLLLQHGFGRSSKFWYRCVPYLAPFYRIIRPEHAGLGPACPSID